MVLGPACCAPGEAPNAVRLATSPIDRPSPPSLSHPVSFLSPLTLNLEYPPKQLQRNRRAKAPKGQLQDAEPDSQPEDVQQQDAELDSQPESIQPQGAELDSRPANVQPRGTTMSIKAILSTEVEQSEQASQAVGVPEELKKKNEREARARATPASEAIQKGGIGYPWL